jgi:very-short-patch-repair endonuclease
MTTVAPVARTFVFIRLCELYGIPAPIQEHRFHPVRKWRWDFAWPEHKLALEVDGGVWVGGKHGRGAGIVKDHAKQNAAAELGWRVMRVTPRQLASIDTVAMVRRALQPTA